MQHNATDLPAGIGTLTPSVPIFAPVPGFEGPGSIVFSDFRHGIISGAAALSTYDGVSSIGPVPVFFSQSAPLPSDMGDFVISSAGDLVFQAVGVPEPVPLALFGAGVAGIGAMRRRKQKA